MAKLIRKKTTAVAKGGKAPARTPAKTPAKTTTKTLVRKGTGASAVRTPSKSLPAAKAARGSVAAKRDEVRPAPVRGTGVHDSARLNGKSKSVAAPVSALSPAKPGRNHAGLKAKELESFRELLLAKRRELLGDVQSMEDEALRSTSGSNLSNLPIHMADMGSDNYEQEFTLGLVEKDRQLLKEINIALIKIRDGSYGICEGTGRPIAKARLEAKPWAKYSIEYMQKLENGLVRR